jgi:hypothetical protein
MVLSVTVFKSVQGATNVQQNLRVTNRETPQDRRDRYPVAEADESARRRAFEAFNLTRTYEDALS